MNHRARTLQVNGAINQGPEGSLLRTDPKTESSRRRIDLPDWIVAMLRRLKKTRNVGDDLELLFPNQSGRPLHKSDFIRRSYKPLLKAAGLPDIPFHWLRHSANSKLLDEAVSIKVIQARMGHTTARMTLDTYGYVLPTAQREAADKLDTLFGHLFVGGQRP